MYIGLQKFIINILFVIAEDNRDKLSRAHLREAGYEYISERHFGIYLLSYIQ